MLWIALHLPLLSLESFVASLLQPGVAPVDDPATAATTAGQVADSTTMPTLPRPVALIDLHRIVHANAAAQALGVRPGQKRGTALALAPDLTLGEAHAGRDACAMQAVVHAALAFTPSVTLEPGTDPTVAAHTVQLEVQASLRYFGGLPRLLQRLHASLVPLGHRVQCGSAPTAQGAALLARHPRPLQGRHAADLPTLQRMLDTAPVWLVGPVQMHWEALQGMGLRELRDLRCLPRAGLARRFGEALLDELDRAYGQRADPRDWQVLPPVFESRLELFARADTTEQVLQGATILLARLLVWARAQHVQVRRFTLRMQHESRHRHDVDTPADSTLDIALAEPSSDAAHLLSLLRERLGRIQLVAPTLELQLDCSDTVQRAPPNRELFPTKAGEREGLTRLIERLQARLGPEQVQRLVLIDDHRSAHATQALPVEDGQAPGTSGATGRTTELHAARGDEPVAGSSAGSRSARHSDARRRIARPVWLLPQPQPLADRQSLPLLDGRPLDLLSGPERIEAGWWSSTPVARDYFIAQTREGALIWLFRERSPPLEATVLWFMQGRFG